MEDTPAPVDLREKRNGHEHTDAERQLREMLADLQVSEKALRSA